MRMLRLTIRGIVWLPLQVGRQQRYAVLPDQPAQLSPSCAGSWDADDIVLLFVEPSTELRQQIRAQHGQELAAGTDLPNKSLRGFQRVSLPAGGSQDLTFMLESADFSYAYAGGACIASVGLQLLPWCCRPVVCT